MSPIKLVLEIYQKNKERLVNNNKEGGGGGGVVMEI